MLFRPQLFLRGARLLFGDHAMFFRRADFLAVGGCDPTLLVMEEADARWGLGFRKGLERHYPDVR